MANAIIASSIICIIVGTVAFIIGYNLGTGRQSRRDSEELGRYRATVGEVRTTVGGIREELRREATGLGEVAEVLRKVAVGVEALERCCNNADGS
jgi:hypothetical protein